MQFSGMGFLILFLVLITLVSPIFISAEEDTPYSQKSKEDIMEKSFISKIHPIVTNWQKSEDPDKFAQQNNLFHENGTIGVYIHLTNKEFQASIASETKIMSSYGKTIYALVTSEQLDDLSKLDYVEKITPPDLARTPPIPKPVQETLIQEESQNDYLLLIILGGIVVGTAIGIVIAFKYKTGKPNHS
jgi:hypothetical protein